MVFTDFHFSDALQWLVVILLAWAGSKIIKRYCVTKAEHQQTPVQALIMNAIRKPLLFIPWLLALLYFAHFWLDHEKSGRHDSLLLIEEVLLILLPAWMIWRITQSGPDLIQASGARWSQRISGSVLTRIVQMLVLLITIISIAQMLGYSLSTLLAFGGIGGIVIGMAAREWLANFFGGLMLVLDRPFSEGDWISSPDRAIEGHVESIGWRLTRIRTFDRRPRYVPNSLFTGIVVENPSRMRNRRMVEDFGLRYDDLDKLPMIFSRIMELVAENPDIDQNEPKYACFIRYGDSALICQVRVHIKKTSRVEFLQIQQWVLMTIARVVAEQGAEFAYPTHMLLSPADDKK